MSNIVPLAEVCEIVMGQAPPGDCYNVEGDGWPLIAGAGDFGHDVPRAKKFTTSATRLSQPGDVVLGIRATIGEKVLADGVYCLGRGVAGLRPKKQLDRRYLWHWLASVRAELAAKGRGATFLQVNRNDIAALGVPLPPIDEQRRIAVVLDQADELRAKRRESIDLLDSLTEAIFLDLFGDPVTNPRGWRDDELLGDVALIASGITKGRRLRGRQVRSVPYLAVANVQDGHLRLDGLKRIDATPDEIERYQLVPGDLVLTEGGDPDKLGRGTVWRGEVEECIHQNHIFRVRVVDDGIEPVFLSKLLAGERGRRYFLRSAKQTTGIASINMSQLRAFPLLRPPIELQRAFLSRLDERERLMMTTQRSTKAIDELFASLQQRAFSGAL